MFVMMTVWFQGCQHVACLNGMPGVRFGHGWSEGRRSLQISQPLQPAVFFHGGRILLLELARRLLQLLDRPHAGEERLYPTQIRALRGSMLIAAAAIVRLLLALFIEVRLDGVLETGDARLDGIPPPMLAADVHLPSIFPLCLIPPTTRLGPAGEILWRQDDAARDHCV